MSVLEFVLESTASRVWGPAYMPNINHLHDGAVDWKFV